MRGEEVENLCTGGWRMEGGSLRPDACCFKASAMTRRHPGCLGQEEAGGQSPHIAGLSPCIEAAASSGLARSRSRGRQSCSRSAASSWWTAASSPPCRGHQQAVVVGCGGEFHQKRCPTDEPMLSRVVVVVAGSRACASMAELKTRRRAGAVMPVAMADLIAGCWVAKPGHEADPHHMSCSSYDTRRSCKLMGSPCVRQRSGAMGSHIQRRSLSNQLVSSTAC